MHKTLRLRYRILVKFRKLPWLNKTRGDSLFLLNKKRGHSSLVNTAIGRDLRLCGNAKCREK
nr:MAG TPA: hypothetical protein [Caudoviricetes sp.]